MRLPSPLNLRLQSLQLLTFLLQQHIISLISLHESLKLVIGLAKSILYLFVLLFFAFDFFVQLTDLTVELFEE